MSEKTFAAGPVKLYAVTAHEVSHAVILAKASADVSSWGRLRQLLATGDDVSAQERAADCAAAIWGASRPLLHYWACPASAESAVRAFLGTS